MSGPKAPRKRKPIGRYPAAANTPALKSKESPGRKNPKNNPDSAKTKMKIPINPIACIKGKISKICIKFCGVKLVVIELCYQG